METKNYDYSKIKPVKVMYQKEMPVIVSSIIQSLYILLAICLICVCVFKFVYAGTQVSGASMYPTLNKDITEGLSKDLDTVYYNRFAKGDYGDIVVIHTPKGKHPYVIKRIVAKGGDKIAYVELPPAEGETESSYNLFLIKKGSNERIIIEENYLAEDCNQRQCYYDFKSKFGVYGYNFTEIYDEEYKMEVLYLTIPDNCVYYLGDNRENSTDSIENGPISVSNIVGRVDIIVKNGKNHLSYIIPGIFNAIFN